jgi:polyisoprenoid-binding protein YceI
MKQTTKNTAIAYLLLLVPFFSAYHPAPEYYIIDTKESVITWKCSMVLAGKGSHNGFVSLANGQLILDRNQLVGGNVEVEMKSISDEHHRSDNNLIEHLQSPDFFDVEKFPSSTFTITRVIPEGSTINVTGKLTIKGITHEVTFPANMESKGRTLYANGKLAIDRSQWDVRYGSGKFFDNLADDTISDTIEFEMKLVAKK